MFGRIERYLLRTCTLAFAATLLVLTMVIWLTQALKQFDLITLKGQSLLIFLAVTGLTVPSLVMIIAPIALFIGILFTLNRLNADSELVVMGAAGLSPLRLLKPFAALTVAVAALVGVMSLWAVPWGFRELRDLITHVRADFITRIVEPGTFTTLDQGFVFHYREKGPDDSLLGLFIQDRRDPKRVMTYLAERGATRMVDGENFLALEKGSLQREDTTSSTAAAIVVFGSYNIDLTQFGEQVGPIAYKPMERSTPELMGALARPDGPAGEAGALRAELLTRLTSPLYAFAFGLIGVAALAEPRTTRQGRGGTIAAAAAIVLAVRVAGFLLGNAVVKTAALAPLAVLLPVAAAACGLAWLLRRPRPGPRRRVGPAAAAA